jgi:hypothetical protein
MGPLYDYHFKYLEDFLLLPIIYLANFPSILTWFCVLEAVESDQVVHTISSKLPRSKVV